MVDLQCKMNAFFMFFVTAIFTMAEYHRASLLGPMSAAGQELTVAACTGRLRSRSPSQEDVPIMVASNSLVAVGVVSCITDKFVVVALSSDSD